MEFRTRDYDGEVKNLSLPRIVTDSHPLAVSPPSRTFQIGNFGQGKNDVSDPLRAGHDLLSVPAQDLPYISMPSKSEISLEKEWNTLKKFLVQKFPPFKMVSVSSISVVVVKGAKVHESSSTILLNEIDNQQKVDDQEGVVSISQQDYVAKLSELKSQIVHAWNTDDRVTSLKLSIMVARLLMDTGVSQFYPTLFSLATEILDMLGDMVWKRIKQKAEFSEDGIQICSLPEDFQSSDICSEAKDTCYNWFCKIGSIRELLPRIYLELALCHCWRFLLDQPDKVLHRLVMMTRGLSHPLASAYCHLYIAYCGKKMHFQDRGYLITSINEINVSLLPSIAQENITEGTNSKSKDTIISLIEPTIGYIMKLIFQDPNHQVNRILVELGVQKSQNVSRTCISVILHHLLKELPVELININALDILQLIECSTDLSFPQCINFRLLGFRLSEQSCSIHTALAVVEKIIEAVNQYNNLDEYLKVVDAYVDILLQNQMRNHLQIILGGIETRACSKWTSESEMEGLQSILVKVLTSLSNFEDALKLEHFTEILEVLRGRSRSTVNALILSKAIRNSYISDPTTIHFLFQVAQGLHHIADSSNMTQDGDQQLTQLLSRFMQLVDYGMDLERHLAFLVDCRGAFADIDELKVSLVHMSNNLAIKALKQGKIQFSLIRSCLAFSEVTIPSIYGNMKQLHLYLETAEVALMCSLISHSDGFVDSAMSCLESFELINDAVQSVNVDEVVSAIRKLCNLMLLVPGNLNHGATYIPKSLSVLANSQSWITVSVKIRILCGVVLSLAALSHSSLQYNIASKEKVLRNDLLFFGDSSYHEELKSFTVSVVESMSDIIQQEHSKAARGGLALEACNCIVLSFKMDHEVVGICTKLVETAKSCLCGSDPFLHSTINFLDKKLHASRRLGTARDR